jgi:hypothetical protein
VAHLLDCFLFKHVVAFWLAGLDAPIHHLQLDARPRLHVLPHRDLAEGVGGRDSPRAEDAALLVGAHDGRVVTKRGEEPVFEHEVRHDLARLQLAQNF